MATIKARTVPPLINMQRVGATNWDVFLAAGKRIANSLAEKLTDAAGTTDLRDRSVFDFGCGCGRVLFPMVERFPQASFTAADVDASAIAYLSTQLDGIDLRATSFDPPLPFASGSFDIIYSISIWTHLAPKDQRLWAEELARIMKPGGIALISFSSFKALATRKQRKDEGWDAFSDDDLRKRGTIFLPYPAEKKRREKWSPGITRPYGLTLNDPNQLSELFSGVLKVEAVHNNAIDGVQDLAVCRR